MRNRFHGWLSLIKEYLVYKEGVWSDLGYFAIADFHDRLLQIFLPLRPEVEGTAVRLRQSVSVAVNVATLTLYAEQPHLFIAVKASLFVLLLPFRRLKAQLLHWLKHLPFGHAHGGGGFRRGLSDYFFLFAVAVLPSYKAEYLWQDEQRPPKVSDP